MPLSKTTFLSVCEKEKKIEQEGGLPFVYAHSVHMLHSHLLYCQQVVDLGEE